MVHSSDNLSHSTGEGWILGIGASAGGLEALSLFLSHLPENFSASVIIAQHLAPHSKSMMVELLQRQSKLPVLAAHNNQEVQASTIYVAPPNHDIVLAGNKIILTIAGKETRPKPSIDELFSSLASSLGERAVGIVLSGTGSDGSHGIQAIKAVGGITLAQDDSSAKYDGMPKSAVSTGDVDSVMAPEQLAKELPRILEEHNARIRYAGMNQQGYSKILKLLRERHGTDFSQYKASTIQRRIGKRMAFVHAGSFVEYHTELESNPGELAQLAQEMLVSVTSFFRDPEVFQRITASVAKIVSEKRSGEEVRVWVAGCATGEEAYSMAILFVEELERQRKHLPIKVFATDLDHDALLEARTGVYSAKECERVSSERLHKFFEPRGDQYEVSKRLREIVVFARQDLTENPPFVKLDLISCRNVLIYFNNELQKKVIEIFHYALLPSGILVLGKSETVSMVANLFETVDRSDKVYRKLNVPSRAVPTKRSVFAPLVLPSDRRRNYLRPSVLEQSYAKLLRSYKIAGVTVDEECNILQIIGDVSPYLGFFSPQADFHLTSLLPKGVGIEVPLLIRKATQDGEAHRSRIYREGKGDKARAFCIVVRPLDDEPSKDQSRPLFVVNFEDIEEKYSAPARDSSISEDGLEARIAELEQELYATREHLQTVIEELGVSNEELQSLNEELSSTNEELQASSEELETTNEELQSSNEELTTVNEELSVKQAELRSVNVSFENVQNSMGYPMVILDEKKRVVRFNPESQKVFNITPSDVGREISRVSSNFEIEDFEERLENAIDKGKASELITEIGNSIYQMRVQPCLDDAKRVTGAILLFIDNTDFLRSQEKLSASENRLRNIIDGSSGMVFLKDTFGRYLLVNEAFCQFFQMDQKKVIGRTDRELFPDKVAVPFRDADLEVLVKREVRRNSEERLEWKGKTYTLLVTRFPLKKPDDGEPYAVGTVAVDISAQINAQDELAKSENRYRAIVEDQAVFVFRHQPNGTINYVNTPFASQFSGLPNVRVGSSFENVIFELDRPRVAQELSKISLLNPVVQYEHRVAGSGLKPKWVRWIHRGIFDQAGKLTEFQAVGFDVTESRQKTDQLIEQDNIYRSIFDHNIDFLSVMRVEGDDFVMESFNRSVAKAMGASYGQLIGRSLRDFMEPSRIEESYRQYRKCVETRKVEVIDETLETPAGIRYFSTTLVPIPGLNGHIERVAAISRDVSTYKHIEHDLRRAKEQADVANKSKSEFLASMSHELRTPLNVVLGMAQLLADTNLDGEQNSFVNSIYRSGKVLLSLIEDVLDVSKIEAGKIKLDAISFNTIDVVKDVLELFTTQARDKKIKLIGDISEEAGRSVIGDPARLRQVLVNLVGNAVKFTDKGSVTVKVDAKFDAKNEEEHFYFSVRDTGIGIPAEAHQKLFQRFSQVESGSSRRFGGSGLGLMISKNLVNMMGGTIGFDSVAGKGSTFWVKVPLPVSKQQDAPTARREIPQGEFANEERQLRILATDDNHESRTLIGLFLSRLGHKVKLAENGRDAIEKLLDDEFDLVLMDVQMPEMDGYEATAEIRQLPGVKSKVPVIALTANAMAGDAEKAFDAGMNDYLTKPIHIAALKDLLSRWAARI